jgi:hypothetical protein
MSFLRHPLSDMFSAWFSASHKFNQQLDSGERDVAKSTIECHSTGRSILEYTLDLDYLLDLSFMRVVGGSFWTARP